MSNSFRVVRVRRGDLITGFRVQKETYRRRPTGVDDFTEYGPGWSNVGRKCYSEAEAVAYLRHLQEFQRERGPETVEEIPVQHLL